MMTVDSDVIKKEITDPIMALVAIEIGGKKRNFAESLLKRGR